MICSNPLRNSFLFLFFFLCSYSLALESKEILVIANQDIGASIRIAEYYCAKRGVPEQNILRLSLGSELTDKISRQDYESKLAEPVIKKIRQPEFFGNIKCLVTTYGVPIKVAGRGPLKDKENQLPRLEEALAKNKKQLANLQPEADSYEEQKKYLNDQIAAIQSSISYITGKETGASVDSELSNVFFAGYELYRWQTNKLKYKLSYWDLKSLMVSRLDGPTEQIAKGLIDKAIAAENKGLRGIAYIDSRGIKDDGKKYSFGDFDQSLRQLADRLKTRTAIPVVEEKTSALFLADQCPSAILYCGWYSLRKYIDAFTFAPGAVGYHIASFEAQNIRDAASTQWCPAMLVDGVTATLGAVDEPYLMSFPKPYDFFTELLDGATLVEAFYHTKPFNSWQLILIGDPLYTPFKIAPNSSAAFAPKN